MQDISAGRACDAVLLRSRTLPAGRTPASPASYGKICARERWRQHETPPRRLDLRTRVGYGRGARRSSNHFAIHRPPCHAQCFAHNASSPSPVRPSSRRDRLRTCCRRNGSGTSGLWSATDPKNLQPELSRFRRSPSQEPIGCGSQNASSQSFDFGATRTMAKPFLHLLCLSYGALCGLFATRFVLNRIPLPAQNEPAPRRVAPAGLARREPSMNWMHRRRPGPGLRPGSSSSSAQRIR
jgi:hypothetical protein